MIKIPNELKVRTFVNFHLFAEYNVHLNQKFNGALNTSLMIIDTGNRHHVGMSLALLQESCVQRNALPVQQRKGRLS